MGVVTSVCLYVGLHLGVVYRSLEEGTILDALLLFPGHMLDAPFSLFPSDALMVGFFFAAAVMADLCLYNSYLQVSGTVGDAHGDAAFETDYRQYGREFVCDPWVVAACTGREVTDAFAPFDGEHKRIVRGRVRGEAMEECRRRSMVFAEDIYLSKNGKWTQRNSNVVVFGASGAGKTRSFLIPNLLQGYGCAVVVDPSGEIEQKTGGFFRRKGYLVRRFNLDDMTNSNRFNPLHYIRQVSDIPVLVQAFLENTKDRQRQAGGANNDFWHYATFCLFSCLFAYLFETQPVERRNLSNALEILRMNSLDEYADVSVETDFDLLFEALGDADPTSYAYRQYCTFKKAPAKTALNILISAAVLISQYLDVPEFSNLTYKDELELDRMGEEDVVLFIQIPQADDTYSWMSSMLFTILLRLLYRKGSARMRQEGLADPELKVPVSFLIDEARNIGKIPRLGEYCATCRKYRISIAPIFQTYSQIVELYGKEGANSIVANCDTTLFLGGSDADTLKMVCDRLGKETVRHLSYGISKGRLGSASSNRQDIGRELMSRIQVEQMKSTECLVFVRAIRPFLAKKYRLETHPNYPYTAEADKSSKQPDTPRLKPDMEEQERVRIKAVGEEGYLSPAVVDSPRRRARERAKERGQLQQGKAPSVRASDLTKSKSQFRQELWEREHPPVPDAKEVLGRKKPEQLFFLDSYAPRYEFEENTAVDGSGHAGES